MTKYYIGYIASWKGELCPMVYSKERKRVRNTFSREEMGTCPQSVYGVRTGKHSVCVCRCWDNRF